LKVSFTGIKWAYIGIGLPAVIIVWLSKAYRMYIIARGMGVKLKLARCFQIYLATCFISHVTPFSSGGTPLQIYLLNRQDIPLGKATAITVVDLGLNTAMFTLLVLTALLSNLSWLRRIQLLKSGSFNWTWLFTGMLLIGILIFLLFRPQNRQMFQKIKWVRQIRSYLIRKGWLKHLFRELILFKEGWLMLLRVNPVLLLWAVFSTIVYWLLYLLLIPLIIWAIGKPVSFVSVISWQLLYNFAQIFIPTPGGSGGSELILSYLFRNLIGADRLGFFVLVWKTYTFFSSLLVGGFYFWSLNRKSTE
jgi:glycosyltransferase 2 family protein